MKTVRSQDSPHAVHCMHCKITEIRLISDVSDDAGAQGAPPRARAWPSAVLFSNIRICACIDIECQSSYPVSDPLCSGVTYDPHVHAVSTHDLSLIMHE